MNSEIKNLELTDLPVLAGWAEDEKTLIQWCGPVFDFPLTVEQLKEWYSESEKAEPTRYIIKAVNEKGEIMGMSELGAIDRKRGTASLCRIFVAKKFRGWGIADKMISEILRYAFNSLNMRRLELNVYSFNSPAIKCYERLGFVREGLKRKITLIDGEIWDGYIYGLLREEWKDN